MRVESEHHALRLTADEWLMRLQSGSLEHPCEQGRRAAEAVGAEVVVLFADVPYDELLRPLAVRNAALPAGTYPVAKVQMAGYAVMFEPPMSAEMPEVWHGPPRS